MVRSVVSKVMWVGRATVFMAGLAVIIALVLGVATAAFGANGDPFILGQAGNSASRVTGLVGNVADATKSALRVRNSGPGSALELRVGDPAAAPESKLTPPMTVDSQARVANLNADLIDGLHSTAFLASDGKAADSELLDGRELSSGRVARNEPPIGGSSFTFLEAGALRLVRGCQRNSSGDARAQVRIETTQAGSAFSAHSVNLGGVERSTFNPGDLSGDIASTGLTTSAEVDHATYSAVAPNGDTLQGEVFAGVNIQGNTCVFSASGID